MNILPSLVYTLFMPGCAQVIPAFGIIANVHFYPFMEQHLLSNIFRRLLRAFLLCILVGFFPLIALWKNNLGQISPSAVTTNLLNTFLYVLIVFLLWLFIVRSPEKTALLSCATSIFVFSFGHLYNLIGKNVLFGFSVEFIKLFFACFIFFAGVCLLIIKIKRTPDPFFLTLPLGLLIIMNAVPILRSSIQLNKPEPPSVVANAAVQSGEQSMPDIYYIVLDAYARNDILNEVIGYDNSEFLNELKDRGFYLPECAFSNYDGTVLTLTSVLNYRLIRKPGRSVKRTGEKPGSEHGLSDS